MDLAEASALLDYTRRKLWDDAVSIASKSDVSNEIISFTDGGAWTPLHWSCYHGNLELTQLIVDHGGEVNAINKQKEIPLHMAALNGHTEIIKLLISKGGKKNHLSASRNTPLHLAAMNAHREAIKALIQNGAMKHFPNEDDDNPFDLFIQTKCHDSEIFELLKMDSKK